MVSALRLAWIGFNAPDGDRSTQVRHLSPLRWRVHRAPWPLRRRLSLEVSLFAFGSHAFCCTPSTPCARRMASSRPKLGRPPPVQSIAKPESADLKRGWQRRCGRGRPNGASASREGSGLPPSMRICRGRECARGSQRPMRSRLCTVAAQNHQDARTLVPMTMRRQSCLTT